MIGHATWNRKERREHREIPMKDNLKKLCEQVRQTSYEIHLPAISAFSAFFAV